MGKYDLHQLIECMQKRVNAASEHVGKHTSDRMS